MIEQQFISKSTQQTERLGEQIGKQLKGGEVFVLKSDLGGGKTTFVRGLARGFGSKDPVASPTFTISLVYSRPDNKQLHHFDFYRLDDAGIVGMEIAEVAGDTDRVVAVEWADPVQDVLPKDTIHIHIKQANDENRELNLALPKNKGYLLEGATS